MRLLLLQVVPQSWAPAVLAMPELSLFALLFATLFLVVGMRRETNDFNILALIAAAYGVVPLLGRLA